MQKSNPPSKDTRLFHNGGADYALKLLKWGTRIFILTFFFIVSDFNSEKRRKSKGFCCFEFAVNVLKAVIKGRSSTWKTGVEKRPVAQSFILHGWFRLQVLLSRHRGRLISRWHPSLPFAILALSYFSFHTPYVRKTFHEIDTLIPKLPASPKKARLLVLRPVRKYQGLKYQRLKYQRFQY